MLKRRNPRRRRTALACAAACASILGAWIYYGNVVILTTRYTVSGSSIPQAFDGFTIVQVSDLHNTGFGQNQERLVQAIKAARPDIIVITGDFIDSRQTQVAVSMQLIHQAVKLAPVYYITGNHESRIPSAFQSLISQMQKAGVHILRDDAVLIERGGASIQLIGLDDPDFSLAAGPKQQPGPMITQKLSQLIEKDAYSILLIHRPELLDTYSASHVKLVFTGHAHGGQVRIPFVGGVIAPHQGLFPAYTEGKFNCGDTTMIISRGLGNSAFPFRVNNPPELVVATLQRA